MNKTKVPSIVTVAVLTLITSVSWVLFSIYRIFTSKPLPSVPAEILEPISPTLDTKQIDIIETRLFYDDSQIHEGASLAGDLKPVTKAATESGVEL